MDEAPRPRSRERCCVPPIEPEEPFLTGYPADEAASYSSIIFRQKRASELFLGYFEGYNLIGVGTSSQLVGLDDVSGPQSPGPVNP